MSWATAPRAALARLEDALAGVALVALVLLPLGEMAARALGTSLVPRAGSVVQHLTLAVAFLGAALAAREGRLLSIATGQLFARGPLRRTAATVAATISAGATAMLARAAWDFTIFEQEGGETFGPDLPTWPVVGVMPVAFGLIAVRLVWLAGSTDEERGLERSWIARGVALLGLVGGSLLGHYPEWIEGTSAMPWLAALLVATVLGGPIFALIGGAACFLFLADEVPLAAVPLESYSLVTSAHLPAIPLFTLAGFLLAEGDVPQRLLRLFRALFAWMPGGTAALCAVLCAGVTVLTGGSGVTILVLGGLLMQALRADGYPERFSLGLLTASGSLGLLLPPALPLILFAIVAQVPVNDLFVGGILPGIVMILLLAGWGMREALRSGVPRQKLEPREAFAAAANAKWELLLPVVLLGSIFGGFATLVESAALTALYVLVMQLVLRRNIRPGLELLGVLRQCLVLLGGVLVILAVSKGFTNWMVDAEIAAALVDFTQEHVESKLLFLLALNVFLLLVGCVMDIFSATVVVVPLIAPLGIAYGIDPVHLGIIFVANLELGYLTPPVGLNLFLASYRFDKPLLDIYRAAVPMLVILGIGVLLVTYVPWLTTGLGTLFG